MTNSANGSCKRRAIEIAPLTVDYLVHSLAARASRYEPAFLALMGSQWPKGRAKRGPLLSESERITVIETLGLIGTVKSIPDLRTHCDEFFDPSGPKQAAKAAITAIQARLKGADVGQLAMVGDEALRGGLSDSEE